MTISLLSAASSIHTVRWANAYAERGHTVHLISLHAASEGLSKEVILHHLPFMAGMGYLLNGPGIASLIRRLGPDVVNAHYATGYGTMARWCKDFPLVLNVWGSDVFEFPASSFLHRAWLLRNLRSADRLVSTSSFMAKRTASLGGALPPITVVPFGVDTTRFAPGPARPPGSALVVGTVKTLLPKYGIDTLLEAFAHVLSKADWIDVRLRIVGGGPEEATLKALAERLKVSDRVDFIGAVPHARVPEELRAMDVYVALSRADSESFGVAVIEASACGLPVVVSDAGGLPEVVRDGITGTVVPRDNPAQAAAALLSLIRDAAERQQWGQAGRSHVMEHYEWNVCVDRMLGVLDDARSMNA
jgi:glycosyltransferase involved in cell wall biosynthesis